MKRKIVHIQEDKCNGCGLCASACHEGAIQMMNGVAKLIRDDYCDGLGDCLPACPTGAISIIEREALAYDEEAVKINILKKQQESVSCNCTGTFPQAITPSIQSFNQTSKLSQWPVQIKLAPIQSPYFKNAKLLIAADCCAYAYATFHHDFMKNRITLIGCPKLDNIDYSEKLSEILKQNTIVDICVVRMEVPCCGGISYAVEKAIQKSNKQIPYKIITISTKGAIVE